MSKHIVIYNWVQFDDQYLRGGGVSVYLRNVIPELLRHDWKVTFLSSGQHYSGFKRKPYIRETSNQFFEKGVRSYRVINSPIKAPAHDSFYDIEQCLDNVEIVDLLMGFLSELPKVHELHIHNIEGISTRLVEELKKSSSIRVKIWLHNYHWVCPQIDLFRDSSKKCNDYRDGVFCLGCITDDKNISSLKNVQALGSFLELNRLANTKIGAFIYAIAKNGFPILKACQAAIIGIFVRRVDRDLKFAPLNVRLEEHTRYHEQKYLAKTSAYKRWREVNVQRLNAYTDSIYAVSAIVKEQVVRLGVISKKVRVAPLGMDVYKCPEQLRSIAKTDWHGEKLRIVFMGYPIASKGLGFMCDALSLLQQNYKEKLSLTVVSRLDKLTHRRIVRLAPSIEVKFLDGYERDQLQTVADLADLLVMPPIWWETFNQVTYEMIMHGVPVLISDSVGISSFITEKFKFLSGDVDSLNDSLRNILDRKVLLADFWAPEVFDLPSIESHVTENY